MATHLTYNRSMTAMICVFLLAIGIHQTTAALTQALCSNYNTGSDSADVTDNFQSNGRCFETCKASYAFAVVQDTSCWCSNYAPADSVDVDSCGTKCPGYGFENCGSLPDGLYGYVALSKKPSGTIGASTSSSSILTSTSTSILTTSTLVSAAVSSTTQPAVSAQSDIPSSPNTVTVQQTVTASQSVVISVVSITPSPIAAPQATTTAKAASSSSSTTAPTTLSSSTTPVATILPATTSSSAAVSQATTPTSTWSPTPVQSTIITQGVTSIITVTPSLPPVETAAPQIKSNDGGFINNKSAVAGVFTTLGLVVLAVIGFVVWLIFRRRRHAGAIPVGSIAGGDTPQRRPSRLSQMGLVGGTTRSSVHGIQTTGLGSSHRGETSADITPISPRASYPRIVDQRLDPDSLWQPLQRNNGSHASLGSFQDHHDYSRRVLHVANPDT